MSGIVLHGKHVPARNPKKDSSNEQFELHRPEGSLATWIAQATPGTTYWRCHLPAKYLPGECIVFRGHEDVILNAEANTIDLKHAHSPINIWQFMGDENRSRIAFHLQDRGTPTWQELDDNYINMPPTHMKGGWARTVVQARQWLAEGKSTGYSHEQHKYLTPLFDGLIVSTDYLANKYEKYNDNIHVCPNSVDPGDWNVEREESETLRFGYYASASHHQDWPLVKKAVKKLLREKGVSFHVIGFNPPGYSGEKLPWEVDMFKGRQNLGKLDVGIAPLSVNPWSNSKSDVKGLEYAMAGVMPVLQGNATSYSPWDHWPFRPVTAEDWMDTLMDIVRNRDQVKHWAAEAKKYVLEKRTIQDNIHLWREALGSTA